MVLLAQKKKELLKKNIVLCKNLHDHMDELRNIGVSDSKIKEVLEETSALCGSRT